MSSITFTQPLIELYSIKYASGSLKGESIMKLQLKTKLLDRGHQALRLKNYSYLTEKAHVFWIKRFIFFRD
jgi:hypothetical protein